MRVLKAFACRGVGCTAARAVCVEVARLPRWCAVRSYCDEFECTSSPAVEQTVRALARDLTRLRTWTLSLFAKDVRYQVLLCTPVSLDS